MQEKLFLVFITDTVVEVTQIKINLYIEEC